MKNLLMIVISLCGIGSLTGQEVAQDSSYANGYYVERLAGFKNEAGKKVAVVLMGNSITEAGNWEELLAQGSFANRGISGDNTYGVLARLDEALSLKPQKLFLMIGVNDLKRGTPREVVVRNHRRIAKKLRREAPQVELYIQSILPVRDSMLADFYLQITNQKIDWVNSHLKQLAEEIGATYVELNKEVFADQEGLMQEHYTTDGLHLTKEGYQAWVDYLKLKEYL